MAEPAFLAKSRESLASARSDIAARRYNSAANRAYYGAFQAAVALLIADGVRPRRDTWEHRFVIGQFSSRLIRRRKLLPSEFRPVLDRLMSLRITADYKPVSVSSVQARHALRDAGRLCAAVESSLRGE